MQCNTIEGVIKATILVIVWTCSTMTNGQCAVILNASFESGVALGSGFIAIPAPNTTSIGNWTVGGGGVDYLGSSFQAANGSRSIDLSRVSPGSIQQQLTGLEIGQWYRVSFMMAGNPDTSAGPNLNPIKRLTISAAGFSSQLSFDITNRTLLDMGWSPREFYFLANNSSLDLVIASNENSFYGPVVDDFSIDAVPEPSTVVTRAIRYIGATGASASALLATDKVALLPGQASTFANYTNYARGLNGIVVDVNGLPSGTTNAQMLASLQFARWNGIDAGGFVALPRTVVPTVAIAAGGAGGSARVTITFADNAVQNTWLRVTLLSNASTGLAANDVFYFGNVIGELDFGNTATRLRVNGQDAALLLGNQSPGANSVPVTNKFDLNRDGRVNGQDYAFLLANQQAAGIVAPITAP